MPCQRQTRPLLTPMVTYLVSLALLTSEFGEHTVSGLQEEPLGLGTSALPRSSRPIRLNSESSACWLPGSHLLRTALEMLFQLRHLLGWGCCPGI